MNKISPSIAGLLCMALCFGALAADTSSGSDLAFLKQDSGKNATEMNLSLFSMMDAFGPYSLDVGEAVKFKAPKPGWRLYGVQVLGWSEFNDTTETLPPDRNFLLEVRDKDLHLLYRFADVQNGYFLSSQGPFYGVIEIPPLEVDEEFYVVFYDRGGMAIMMESDSPTGNSFIFINGEIQPAQFTTKANETVEVNWMIEAVGR